MEDKSGTQKNLLRSLDSKIVSRNSYPVQYLKWGFKCPIGESQPGALLPKLCKESNPVQYLGSLNGLFSLVSPTFSIVLDGGQIWHLEKPPQGALVPRLWTESQIQSSISTVVVFFSVTLTVSIQWWTNLAHRDISPRVMLPKSVKKFKCSPAFEVGACLHGFWVHRQISPKTLASKFCNAAQYLKWGFENGLVAPRQISPGVWVQDLYQQIHIQPNIWNGGACFNGFLAYREGSPTSLACKVV